MKFIWRESARSELRSIHRDTAVRILHALARFGSAGEGDLKALSGEWQGFSRIRVGEYRVVLTVGADEITVVRVSHRSRTYR